MKKLTPFVIAGVLTSTSCAPSHEKFVSPAVEQYRQEGLKVIDYPPHTATGEYLWFGNKRYTESNIITFDDDGLVQYINAGEPVYNVVTLAHYALSWHGRHIRSGEPIDMFLKATNKLLEMQQPNGGVPYLYSYKHYAQSDAFDVPWFSGMAQGHVISTYARAYDLTGDQKYRDAGEIALTFMMAPTSQGGTATTLADLDASLSSHIWIEEWVTTPASYTLNGYMFALLGLYDWCHAADSQRACDWFDQGIESLLIVLPKFDIGGFSVYDLAHHTLGVDPMPNIYYHKVHIELLRSLGSVTGESELLEYADRWLGYVAGNLP